MALSGNVVLSILDGSGASVQIPATSLQVVIGCAASGTVGEIVPTRSLSTLSTTFGAGPLLTAAGLTVSNGGTVLAIRADADDDGYVEGTDRTTVAITDATETTPIVITAAGHGLTDGSVVTIASCGGITGCNGVHRVHALSSSTFQLLDTIGGGTYTSGGTVQFEGVIMSGTGTTVATASTSDPNDDYFVQLDITRGGTVGTGPIAFTVSLDGGRTHGPTAALDTDLTYEIEGTGIIVTFTTGKTLVTGDRIRFSTRAPAWGDSDIADALEALRVSAYANLGWGGGTHIVGVSAQADVAAIAGSGDPCLDSLADDYVFTRGIFQARDVNRPAAWGGPATAETESAWMSSIIADFNSLSAKRALVAAGFYNMVSPFKIGSAGAPRLRVPLAYAYAARQVAIPPQRHAGRTREDGRGSGSIKQIILDALNDPKDGFVYHDEELNPALDSIKGGAGRFCTARTRKGLPGMYFSNPILSSPPGSDFDLYPKGAVMDIASGIVVRSGQLYINDDIRTNENGTIDERDAKTIEAQIGNALRTEMVSAGMCTAATVIVDRDYNVKDTSRVKVGATIRGKAYILEFAIELGFESTTATA